MCKQRQADPEFNFSGTAPYMLQQTDSTTYFHCQIKLIMMDGYKRKPTRRYCGCKYKTQLEGIAKSPAPCKKNPANCILNF